MSGLKVRRIDLDEFLTRQAVGDPERCAVIGLRHWLFPLTTRAARGIRHQRPLRLDVAPEITVIGPLIAERLERWQIKFAATGRGGVWWVSHG